MTQEAAKGKHSSKPARKKSAFIETLLSILGIFSALSIGLTAWFYQSGRLQDTVLPTSTAPIPTPTLTVVVDLPVLDEAQFNEAGIARQAVLHTTLPDFSTFEIKKYQVQKGDTLYGIADKFKLKPSSILWGNGDVLYDSPDLLSVGMQLRIMPEDGVLYTWSKDDGLNGVAQFFKVSAEEILNWPGNHLNGDTIGDFSKPNIGVGTQLFIPGGKREFISTSVPIISRRNPAQAKVMGPGYCGTVSSGATGTGTFVWPSSEHSISGYPFDPGINHYGVDVAGQLGNPVYATDGGVVVYAGWNDWGFGNLIIIDHGNGWQSLYGHLSAILVGCGQSVAQGAQIATLGSTGNSTGPHLHFELSISGSRVNPLGYIQ